MKSFGFFILFLLLLTSFTGCYTVVYHSDSSEISEVVYSEPIYIPVPIPIPYPPQPVPHPNPTPNDPPMEKVRPGDNQKNNPGDSYKSRDPLRNQGGRGLEERNSQGRN
jgi:hypothetical protein